MGTPVEVRRTSGSGAAALRLVELLAELAVRRLEVARERLDVALDWALDWVAAADDALARDLEVERVPAVAPDLVAVVERRLVAVFEAVLLVVLGVVLVAAFVVAPAEDFAGAFDAAFVWLLGVVLLAAVLLWLVLAPVFAWLALEPVFEPADLVEVAVVPALVPFAWAELLLVLVLVADLAPAERDFVPVGAFVAALLRPVLAADDLAEAEEDAVGCVFLVDAALVEVFLVDRLPDDRLPAERPVERPAERPEEPPADRRADGVALDRVLAMVRRRCSRRGGKSASGRRDCGGHCTHRPLRNQGIF